MKWQRNRNIRRRLAYAAVGSFILLTSCGSLGPPPTPGESTLTLYAAGVDGSPPILLGTAASNRQGGFGFTYTCPSPNALLYAVASGGNGVESEFAGDPGTMNPSIKLMAALGPCSSAPSQFVINELTTVAAVYALNAFRTISAADPLGDMTQLQGKTPAITNAFATAALLADVMTGSPSVSLPTARSCMQGGAPVNCSGMGRLTALANALFACVRSAGGSAPCMQLFGDTNNATDTLQAALFIARNPGLVNIQDIFSLSQTVAAFLPGLSAAPTDWTISLNFTGGGMQVPSALAIDGNGNVWVTNAVTTVTESNKTVTALSATGMPLAGSPFFTGGGTPTGIAIDGTGMVWVTSMDGSGLHPAANAVSVLAPDGRIAAFYNAGDLGLLPEAIAIDGSGNAWIANLASVTVLSSAGAALFGSPITAGGLNSVANIGIAIDGSSGDAWIVGNNPLAVLSSAGVPLFGSPISVGGLNQPTAIASDNSSGNVWIANSSGGGGVSAFSSTGVPLFGSPIDAGGLNSNVNALLGIAVDGGGNVWVLSSSQQELSASNGATSVIELSSMGLPLSPGVSGFTGGGLNAPSEQQRAGIAIDGSGDVWVANAGNNSVTEFIGAATPTATPLVAQIHNPTNPPPPPASFSVGGMVSGLTGTGLVLQDNGGDNLAVGANGSFTFAQALLSGATYAVTVLMQPTGQSCGVANGVGTVGLANITSVVVNCSTSTTSGLSCLPRPSPQGGGAQVYDNQSFCVQLAGTTDLGASFSGTLTFTTALTPGPIIGCEYLVSLSPTGTAPTACTGTTDASGNLSIVDAVNESNSNTKFAGTFAPSVIDTVSGTWSSDNFAAAGGAVVTGTFSGTQQ